MGEYYRCDKCTGLKVRTTEGWQEFGIRDNCKHDFVYSKVERTGYIAPIKKKGKK